MQRRGWWWVFAAAIALALASLASNVVAFNVVATNQAGAETDALLIARKTVSIVLNTGTIWAGLAVLSGWFVRRPLPGAAAGVVATLTALVLHYALGVALGVFHSGIWADNVVWFAGAVVAGGPLGMVGAVARRRDLWGVAARLVVPAGAVLEPIVTGMFTGPELTGPGRVASIISGLVLLTAGAAGASTVVVVAARQRSLGILSTHAESSRLTSVPPGRLAVVARRTPPSVRQSDSERQCLGPRWRRTGR